MSFYFLLSTACITAKVVRQGSFSYYNPSFCKEKGNGTGFGCGVRKLQVCHFIERLRLSLKNLLVTIKVIQGANTLPIWTLQVVFWHLMCGTKYKKTWNSISAYTKLSNEAKTYTILIYGPTNDICKLDMFHFAMSSPKRCDYDISCSANNK